MHIYIFENIIKKKVEPRNKKLFYPPNITKGKQKQKKR